MNTVCYSSHYCNLLYIMMLCALCPKGVLNFIIQLATMRISRLSLVTTIRP